jgi:hypothetical protein
MATFKIVLLCSALVVGIVWVAVFLCGLRDRLQGVEPPDFIKGEEEELPPKEPRPWWQHVLRSPIYALLIVFMVVLGIFLVPPLAVLGGATKLKTFFFRRILRRI